MKKILTIATLLVLNFTMSQARDFVQMMAIASSAGASSAISIIAVSGVAGVAVIAAPAMVEHTGQALNNNTNKQTKKLEVSEEVVTAYDYKNDKDSK